MIFDLYHFMISSNALPSIKIEKRKMKWAPRIHYTEFNGDGEPTSSTFFPYDMGVGEHIAK